MIHGPINDLYYSLSLFVEHQLLQKSQAYTNIGSNYYYMQDPVLPNLSVYSAPYKQIVYDSSISGANILSGVYVNGNFNPRSSTGLQIDFLNNRAIFSGGYNNLAVSGNYALKDFNVYMTTKTDDELVYETAFQVRPSFQKALSGLAPDSLTVPGVFIANSNFNNETYAFGGLIESTMNVHCIVLTDSRDQLDAVGSYLADERYNSFPIISSNYLPLNFYGDFKTGLGGYNYLSYVNQFPNNLGYVADVEFYKLSNRDFSNRYPDLRAAFVDFQVKWVRLPNQRIN